MRVLKEEVRARSAADERLADLVRSAEPYRPNPFRKRLVLLRIERASERSSSHFVLRSAVVGSLLLGGTATALGAIGYRLLMPEPAATPTAATARAATPRRDPAPPAHAAPKSAALEAPAASPPSPEAEQRSPAPRARPVAARDPSSRRPSTTPGEDPSQVLEAVRALRKEGDAPRAQALLDDYLAAHPKGALTEDALGLAIEAAAARRDPRAAEYARRYLQRFPNGRFRAVAERAAGRR